MPFVVQRTFSLWNPPCPFTHIKLHELEFTFLDCREDSLSADQAASRPGHVLHPFSGRSGYTEAAAQRWLHKQPVGSLG